jgi:glycine C-acetyltransferase
MHDINFAEASLMDFLDAKDKDIMGRASFFNEYARYIKDKKHDYYRRVSTDGSGPIMTVIDQYTGKERKMIYLASNDYLNLTKHPKTISAGIDATKKYGSGAGSVPLLGGTLDIHVELEKKIAKFKGCQDAILYSSGYGSNCGSLLALLQEKDIAILDMLVHASTIDGCKNTNVKYFRHNNLDSLEKILDKSKRNFRTKLVVVDGVYSMDGDIAPLDKIIKLAKALMLMLWLMKPTQQCHRSNGRGTPEHFNIEGKVDIVSGTFSKLSGGSEDSLQQTESLLNFYIFSPVLTCSRPPPRLRLQGLCSKRLILLKLNRCIVKNYGKT